MGIFKLMELLRENAPDCIKQRQLGYFSGMTIALDASMAMYQFIISTQGYDQASTSFMQLTDNDGNKTSHLLGLFNRTMTLLQEGIKPVWVFDGKPPTNKNGQLMRRKRIKEEAADKADELKDIAQMEEALKQQQRTTRISKTQKEDAMKMLTLMGVPVIQAPGEAEAQCSVMCSMGKVDCVGTEDMDALTFGAKVLVRNFNQKKEPVYEINHQIMLQSLKMTEDEFIDLCILCGCDYCPKIAGIGPVKAYKFMQEYKSIDKVLNYLYGENKGMEEGKSKYGLPDKEEYKYEDARYLFKNPSVDREIQFKFDVKANLNEQGLKAFLVDEKNFNAQRVQSGIRKIKSSSTKGVQPRLEAFFGKPTVIKHSDNNRNDDKKKGKSKSATKKKM